MNNKEKLNPTFYDEKGRLLPEFRKFNWGACIFGFIWGICNKSYLTFLSLLIFIPNGMAFVAGIAIPIWLGYEGNKWAIENKKWESAEHFNHVQRLWAIWSFVISFMILVPFIVGYAFLITWIVQNPEKANEIIIKFSSMQR